MYAVKPTSANLARSTTLDANATAMSRLPIAALLGPDRPNASVEKLHIQGRTYYKYQNDLYNFPADDDEFERLDVMHHLIYLVAFNKQLHLAPFRTAPKRVLDVGFGTGYWMFEMEKLYPHAEIIGVDLDSLNGSAGSSRCIFRSPVDFNAPTWPVENHSVDLVHMSQLCGCVPDWLAHYNKAFRCLRPGTGQIEHVEIDWTPRTNEAEFPKAAIDIHNWWYWMCEASQRAGKPIRYRDDSEELLERAGFVDVTKRRIKIPLYTDGRRDRREWALAHGYQTAMGYKGTKSFTGFSMALFTKYLQFTPAQVLDVCDKAVEVVGQRDLPLYVSLHVVTGRRPQG